MTNQQVIGHGWTVTKICLNSEPGELIKTFLMNACIHKKSFLLIHLARIHNEEIRRIFEPASELAFSTTS